MSTTGKAESTFAPLDEQMTSGPASTTASSVKAIEQEPVFLKVAVPSTATNIRVSFDPVSIEEGRQTRELNRSVRLGFVPPAASTRS